MTGKELIVFILNHNLLDVDLSTKVSDLFFTADEAAVKLGISTNSLHDMLKIGLIDYVVFDDQIWICKDVDLSTIGKRR